MVSEKADFLIVGSGPAGVAAVWAVLKSGRRCTLIDGGQDLEPEKTQMAAELARLKPSQWPPEKVGKLFQTMKLSASGVDKKLLFGSDFPYRYPKNLNLKFSNAHLDASHAVGGFGNVWGAAALPYQDKDFDGWPIGESEIRLAYDAVQDLLTLSSSVQATPHTDLFQLQTDARAPELRKKGIEIRRGQLALSKSGSENCQYCGKCFHGCVYDVIFNPRQVLEHLKRNPLLSYHTDLHVESYQESDDEIALKCKSRVDDKTVSFRADRVLLGAGAISTARIIMDSFPELREIEFKDSQYSLMPVLSLRGARRFRERNFSLSQLFLKVDKAEVSPHRVHGQIYGYNDFFETLLMTKAGIMKRLLKPVIDLFLSRFFIIQTYIHSEHSALLRMKKDGKNTFSISGVDRPDARKVMRKISKYLFWPFLRSGLFVIPMATKIMPPGRGFHTGGSFPMSLNPGERQTDLLGRLWKSKRVHLIDSSLFPTIPAPTITYTVMANAFRIASALSREDRR